MAKTKQSLHFEEIVKDIAKRNIPPLIKKEPIRVKHKKKFLKLRPYDSEITVIDLNRQNYNSTTDSGTKHLNSGTDSGTKHLNSGTDSGTKHLNSGTDSGTKHLNSGTDSGTKHLNSGTDSGTKHLNSGTDSGTKHLNSGTDSGTKHLNSGTDSGTKHLNSGTDSGTKHLNSGTDSGTKHLNSGTDSGTKHLNSGTDSGTKHLNSGTKHLNSGTDSGTKHLNSGTDSGTKHLNSGTDSGTKLKGIPFKVINYLLLNLENKKNLITKKISINQLSKEIDETLNSTRQAIRRLKHNNTIKTIEFSTSCSNGYAKFKISRSFYQNLIKNPPERLELTKAMVLEEKKAKITLPLNNSINNISNITNTIKEEERSKDFLFKDRISHNSQNTCDFPSAWLKINIEPLRTIGFSDTQLQQLQNRNTPEVVQESIYQFAYGLEYNEKTKKYNDNALNVLMGVLRKGQAWIEPNYRSPQELALEDLIAQKKEKKNRCNKKLDELMDLEFPAWHNKLSEQEIEEIVPETFRVTRVPQDVVEYLKKYFRDKMLIPRLKEQGISS